MAKTNNRLSWRGHRENVYRIRRRIYAVFATKTEGRRQTVRTYAAPSLYRIETILTDLTEDCLRRDIHSMPCLYVFLPALYRG